jgi:Cu(I)/Ag(I) efflux system membrane protein CusA/SilA
MEVIQVRKAPFFLLKFSLLKACRKIHKWLMAFLGVQFVIWSVTGAYMVFFDIDYIHGDSLIKNHQTKIDSKSINYSLKTLYENYPQAKNIELGTFIEQTVYRFEINKDKYLVNADSGELLSPLKKMQAIAMANHEYTGDGQITEVELIADNPPFELSSRVLPAWRVNYDDFGSPTLYVSATTGKVVTKRHEFWRLFDWIFRFHVMDYQESEVDNYLLFYFSFLGLLAGLSGLVLVYYRIFKRPTQSNTFNERVK